MYPQQEGSGASVVRKNISGHDPGGTALWIRYLSGHTAHGKCPGWVLDLGGEMDDRTAPTETTDEK